MKKCDCGCGKPVTINQNTKLPNKYIHGHQNRGKKFSKKHRETADKANTDKQDTEETKQKDRLFEWTPERYLMARDIASGVSYVEADIKYGLEAGTVKGFMYDYGEFKSYVDKLTLDDELMNRAGASRLLLRMIKEKVDAGAESETVLRLIKYMHELAEKDEDKVQELTVIWK